MPGSVLVVGLLGRGRNALPFDLMSGRTLVSRHRASAERVLPAGLTLDHAYDELFDRDELLDCDTVIANDIAQLAESGDIAYLVPGIGSFGDATVAASAERVGVVVDPGTYSQPLGGQVQIVDALALAQVQTMAPFDAGSVALIATAPVLVLNWHGSRVMSLAANRLKVMSGRAELPATDAESLTLYLPARDPLDSPPSFDALAYITARLRRPDGCPWDREQTHASLLDDFASEVAEYAEAVGNENWPHAAEELGDVLLNVLMQSQIGTEAGHFRIEDVLAAITAKLVRRHPHVFGDVTAGSPDEVLAVWNSVKQQEKDARTSS